MGNASHSAGIMVLGMHRSGTSALARVLHLAGADVGSRVRGASAGNERGHWEDSLAVELHERLLSRFGVRWDDAFALPMDWARSEAAHSARQAIEGYLSSSRSREAVWVVKDPRLSQFGGLWRDAAAALDMPMSAIVLVRHPLEVADSLAARDGIALGTALLLWTEHTLAALRIAEGMPSLLIGYQQLLSDWRGCADRIRQLPGAGALDFEANAEAIAASLDDGMRHHVRAGETGLPAQVAEIWLHVEALTAQGAIPATTTTTLAPELEKLSDLLQPYAEDMRDERRKLWERIARAEEQLSPILGATVQIPAEIQELRTRVDRHQGSIIEAISVDLRRMQEVTTSTVRSAQESEARAVSERSKAEHAELARSRSEAELSLARQQLAGLRAEHDAVEREAGILRGQHADAEREISILRAEIARLDEVADRLRHVLLSRSWRWTRPLRVMARLLRGDWSGEDTNKLRRGIMGVKARMPLVSREFKRQHLVTALRNAQDATPITRAEAEQVALPLAPHDSQLHDVFVWAVIDWHFRTQRPQHLARALSGKGHRVFYVSNNFIDDDKPGFSILPLDEQGRLFQVHLNLPGAPQIYSGMPKPSQLAMMQKSLAEVLRWTGTRSGISIVQHPYWMDLATMLPSPRLVYDCMDHHPGFENNAAEVLRAEERLVAISDLVVVTSAGLEQEVHGRARSTAVIRNAADYRSFCARPKEVFRDDAGRRIIGYYGAIAEWFDVELVRAVATQHADALVLLIGADTVGASAALSGLPNVRFVGEVKYDALPFWLHAFDVCMLPFKVIPLTIATNPVKVYEYLAAGKPVVSVDLPEMAQFGGLVDIAAGHGAFVEAIGVSLLQVPSSADIAARQAFASEQTWTQRVELLEAELHGIQDPLVSIVVLTFNNLDFTKACLSSIEAHSDYGAIEVIVVDNLSSDGSREWLGAWASEPSAAGHSRRLVLNDRNAGFAAGNNIGLRAAAGEFVVILNNDTYVTPGWVRTLCAHFRRDPSLGLVGPVTNNIGNEARLELQYSSMEEMIALAGEHTRANPGGEIPLATAAFFCVAMPRSVMKAVGELDEAFGIGFFEDDDYCRRVEQAGFRVACAEDVFVHHHLSASFEKMESDEKRALFERNKQTYEAKWGAWTPHVYRSEKGSG